MWKNGTDMAKPNKLSETTALLNAMCCETMAVAECKWSANSLGAILGPVLDANWLERECERHLNTVAMREIRNAYALLDLWPME